MTENAIDNENDKPIGAVCPICYGMDTEFGEEIKSWQCKRCSTCWGKTKSSGYFDTPLYNKNDNQSQVEEKL